MKHTKTIFALLAVLTLTANAYGQYYAYDFSATAPSGQTLYYKIYDSTQVSVVHPRTNSSDSNYVSGDLVIPETVSYCGITYTVTELKTHDYMMGAFFNCKSLTSVYVPNTVKYMGEYSFGYCSSLASVHLPDSITEIRRETFSKCYSLQSITLGREVNLIYYGAFLFCNALTEIHSLNNVAPTSFSGAFYDMADSVSVYIPCGSTASYVSEWGGSFSTFIEEPGYALEVAADNEEHGSVEVVSEPTCNNPQAELLATANEGYHFIHWSNGSTDNPLTITLNSDTAITAFFAIDSLSVTISINDESMGGVIGGGIYAYGDTATLTANANEGYHFEGWSITPGYQNIVSDNPLTIIVTEDMTVIAYFAVDSTEGIDDIATDVIKVYSRNGRIVVDGADGEEVHIFDMMGRTIHNEALPTGIYMVRVGNRPARKVVVIR